MGKSDAILFYKCFILFKKKKIYILAFQPKSLPAVLKERKVFYRNLKMIPNQH